MVALCGQIKRVDLIRGVESGSAVYVRRVLGELCDEGTLTEKLEKISRARVIRLGPKFREKFLTEIPTLRDHYNITTNNNLFRNERSYMERMDATSEMIQMAIGSGLQVNNIKLIQKKNALAKRPKKTESKTQNILTNIECETTSLPIIGKQYKENLELLEPGAISYFTSPIVKAHKNELDRKLVSVKINQSRSYGHIFGDGESFAVYDLKTVNATFSEMIERRYRDYIENLYRDIHGTFQAEEREKMFGKGACVIKYKKPEILKQAIEQTIDSSQKSFVPFDVYERCYMFSDKEELKSIIRNAGHTHLTEELFTETEIKKAENTFWWCDAIRDNRPTSELINMDARKIIEIAKISRLAPNEEITLLCKEKDRDILEEIFEKGKVVILTV